LDVHPDNAGSHAVKLSMDFLKARIMRRAPHPPDSPDSAPSDFFLFGKGKRQFSGRCFDNADDLLAAIHDILDGLGRPTLIGVVEGWMRRPQQCIDAKVDHAG
jgi:hypothetical protein